MYETVTNLPRQNHFIRIALAQLCPLVGALEANVATIERVLDAHSNVDLVIFPELFISGYTTQNPGRFALTTSHGLIQRLADRSAKHETALIAGFIEQRNNEITNSALCLDKNGTFLGSYRKAQLFGAEASTFTSGEALRVVKFGCVRIGLMICFDIEFPEVARALAESGTDLLVSVSANMTPFGLDHRLFVQVRALENRLPHVYVNQTGRGEEFLFTGESCYVDNIGSVKTECSPHDEEIAIVEVPLDTYAHDDRPDYLALKRRPLPNVIHD